jgi:hypothetical protein
MWVLHTTYMVINKLPHLKLTTAGKLLSGFLFFKKIFKLNPVLTRVEEPN